MSKSALFVLTILGLANFVFADSLPKSPFEVAPLFEGQAVPKVMVKSVDGEDINLGELLSKQKSVLIFYRGGWCPYCNKHLEELFEVEEDLLKLGFNIIALSPDQPSVLEEHTQDYEFNYQLLSDSDANASQGFGVAYELDGKTLKMLNKYGIDVEQASGNQMHVLPVPAVYIVDKGTIEFAYVNPDYKKRLSGDVILAAAKFSKKN